MSAEAKEVRRIFLESVEIASADDRAEFLARECTGNDNLRRRVEALIEAHERAESLLDKPPLDRLQGFSTPTEIGPVPELAGDTIGPYKLLQEIGQGGFGVVYMAEQQEPVRRRVALKVIKPGMDTREVIARFEAERQALAMMDHPNIARVLDAGTTDSGRPYFVMELVKGTTITAYCDQHSLTPSQRLELFVTVCRAVQHAHQKGVIHRDIKPSNVMITLHDGQPAVKVIDFGVAKAINQQLTEKTMFTNYGQMVGTPTYMSPEQAEMSGLDVDTRTDIYSLGVLLYELLTGTTPFDRKRLASAGYDEIRRIIREEEPPKPSLRLSTLTETLPSVATHRQMEPRKLSLLLRGDLDWIVMKSLEKDRTRRYETASSFASDIQHHLNDEAVIACPPSAAYRFRKFARRNKAAIATTALVAASLIVGIIGTGWQAIRATRERDRATSAEEIASDEALRAQDAEQQAIAAARRADDEATRSQQVALFLTDMLAAAGPQVARGRDATLLKEVLAQTAERVETDLAGQPEVQGDLLSTLGNTYQEIGDHGLAIDMYKKAANRFQVEPGEPNAKLAIVLCRQGFSHSFLKDLPTGTRHADAGVEMARQVGDKETLAMCLYYRAKASNEFGLGSAEAEPYLKESLRLYREIGGHPIEEAKCIRQLAAHNAESEESESFAQQALENFRQHLGPDHPETVHAHWLLGQIKLLQGKAVEAEQLLRGTLESWEELYAEDHPLLYVVRNKLADSLALQGRWDEVYQIIEGTPPGMISKEHQFSGFYNHAFDILSRLGRVDDAKVVIEKMAEKLADIESTYGTDHEYAVLYRRRLADMRNRLAEGDTTRLPPHNLGERD